MWGVNFLLQNGTHLRLRNKGVWDKIEYNGHMRISQIANEDITMSPPRVNKTGRANRTEKYISFTQDSIRCFTRGSKLSVKEITGVVVLYRNLYVRNRLILWTQQNFLALFVYATPSTTIYFPHTF